MSEFNLNHDVYRLMRVLNVDECEANAITKQHVVEQFENSRKQRAKSKNSNCVPFVEKLSNAALSDFKQLYSQLKTTNAVETDNFVALLARIEKHNDLRNFLRLHKANSRYKRQIQTPVNIQTPTVLDCGRSEATESHSTQLEHLSKSSEMKAKKQSAAEAFSQPLSIAINGSLKNETELALGFDINNAWPFLSYDFTANHTISEEREHNVPLSNYSVVEQELLLIEDLFFMLIGIESKFFRMKRTADHTKVLMVDSTGDPLLRTACSRIVSLCPLYSQLTSFMEEFVVGSVNQAFVSSIRGLIKDYFLLVTEIEASYRRNELTLQKMWYFLQNITSNFQLLADVCQKIRKNNCVGGAVVNILHEKTLSIAGDAKACRFMTKVTATTCDPYFKILEIWITEGIIHDPHNEFFIEDTLADDQMIDEDCWKSRFIIVRSRIPIFLANFAETVLKTGKYLSIIKQYDQEFNEASEPHSFLYSLECRNYENTITSAYISSSKRLLRLLLKKYHLIEHLKAIKNYFFMDKGDFIVQFLDISEDQLRKKIDDINPTGLQSLLELSVRTSTLCTSNYNDLLGIELISESLFSQVSNFLNQGCCTLLDDEIINDDAISSQNLFGYESIAFTYRIEWPLSLILHRGSIGFYQMLFRLLFNCKYVEKCLGDLWTRNKIFKRSALREISHFSSIFALQHKMLHFVQNFMHYITFEVIEPKFAKFLDAIETKVHNLDEMIREHEFFYEGLSKECLLMNANALNYFSLLINSCLEFTQMMNAEEEEEETYCIEKLKLYEKQVKEMHAQFDTAHNKLIAQILCEKDACTTSSLVNILYKLDFNEFYAKMKGGYND